MKKLFFIPILFLSLTAFSQAKRTLEYPGKPLDVVQFGLVGQFVLDSTGRLAIRRPDQNPDTLRAICLVTLSPNGIAHARMGFVMIERGKRPVYLDCRKRALKLPQVGWDFREVDVNYKQK